MRSRQCLASYIVWAEIRQNQQCGCAPREDSDQPGHPASLIRVFTVRMKKTWALSYPLSAQRRLWSDWADAQADLSLRWAHSHFVGFVMSWLVSCLYSQLWHCDHLVKKRERAICLAFFFFFFFSFLHNFYGKIYNVCHNLFSVLLGATGRLWFLLQPFLRIFFIIVIIIIIRAATWQNQQSDWAPSEYSDQPGHPPSLVRVFACA